MPSIAQRMMEKTKNLPNAWDIVIEPPETLEDGTIVLTESMVTPATAVGAMAQISHYRRLITELKRLALEAKVDIDSEWSAPRCLQIKGAGSFAQLLSVQIIYFSLRFYVKERYPNLVTHNYDWAEPFFYSEDRKYPLRIWGK